MIPPKLPLNSSSPVFARGPTRDSRLTQPNSPWTMTLGISALAILAVGVFTSLSQARAARDVEVRVADAAPMVLAQNTLPTGPTQTVVPASPQPIPVVTAPIPQPESPDPYLRAPTMVVDLGDGTQGNVQLAQAGGAAASPLGNSDGQQLSADERFAARVSSGSNETARATQLRDLRRIVPQGATIPAVLETAIDSDLPGSVRAVVSQDVRAFDGSVVLIPRGSKLIGQYKSAIQVGQTRAFVVWSRLITPTGISVDIGSPGTDQLGRGGLDGKVDSHFAQRFGGSILLTMLSAGTEIAARSTSNGSSNTLILGAPVQGTQAVASSALQKQIDIPVTIRVLQGTPVQVSVARDLDFSGVVLAAR